MPETRVSARSGRQKGERGDALLPARAELALARSATAAVKIDEDEANMVRIRVTREDAAGDAGRRSEGEC